MPVANQQPAEELRLATTELKILKDLPAFKYQETSCFCVKIKVNLELSEKAEGLVLHSAGADWQAFPAVMVLCPLFSGLFL